MNIRAGRRKIEISHPDKVLFPGVRLTKADLAVYCQNIAQWMLPHIKGRALTLERCPDGIEDGCFMQQEAMIHFPDYVGRAILKRKNGGDLTHVVCNNAATLVYLANMGVAPFTVRSQPDCPVATPLEWSELLDSPTEIHAQSFTITNILERLDHRGDPWQGMARRARSLNGPRRKLNQLMKNRN